MRHKPIDPDHGNGASSAALWYATALAGPALDRLAGAVETDVLIVGAGIAGLSTALHLAEAGIDVAVIEAGQPGSGATGQSGGLVAPDYIRHSPETIGKVLGRQAGEKLTRMVGGSAQACFDLIDRHGIVCDSRQDAFWTPAHTDTLVETQRRYAAQWSSRGFDVRFAEQDEAQRALGSHRYHGALRFGDGGSLNPLSYVRGLARAASGAGAAIFTDSPVEAMTREGRGWHARTAGGTVSARRVIFAANGGNASLHPALQRTTLPLSVIEFATAPLSPEQRAHILPDGGSFTDKTPYVFTARYDGAGRLISAFPISFLVRGQDAFLKEAKRRLMRQFEGIGVPEIESLWEGTAWINTSFLPEIYDLGEDALAIQACNGRGISTNTAIGKEMAAALVTGDFESLSVRPRAPAPIRMHAAATLLPKALMSLAYLSN